MQRNYKTIAMLVLLLAAPAAWAAPTRITMNTGTDIMPHWDPTAGSVKIAYLTTNSSVGLVNSNGTGEQVLIGSGTAITDDALAWVANGTHLLYGNADGAHEMYDYNMSTGTSVEVFKFQGGTTHVGAVASRGDTVIWRLGYNNTPSLPAHKNQLHVDSYNNLIANAWQYARTAGEIVYTRDDSAIGSRGMSILPGAGHAVVSLPNGSLLEGSDLFLVDINSSDGLDNPSELTSTGRTDGKHNWFPEVSPNGSQILFSRSDWTADSADRVYDLFVMNVNGSGVINLTNTPTVQEMSPTWGPNSHDYAFQRYDKNLEGEGDNWNIYVDQVPEPATITLMVAGGLAILKRRRK